MKTCEFSAGAAGARFACYFCTYTLRFRSRASGNALRVLLWYLKLAICQPELRERASHTTFCTYNLRMSCRSCGSALRVLTRDRESRPANHETTSKHRFASKENRKIERAASTRRIFAEASPRARRTRMAPQRERFDTQDLRRGFAELKTNSARVLQHAGSPQGVRREQDKFARRNSESVLTRRISAEGSPSSRQIRVAISTEGSPRARQIRTAPQRERFDTQDLRRGFAESKTTSHGATARAF